MHPDYTLGTIIVLPFVAAFFYVYFRIKYPWVFAVSRRANVR